MRESLVRYHQYRSRSLSSSSRLCAQKKNTFYANNMNIPATAHTISSRIITARRQKKRAASHHMRVAYFPSSSSSAGVSSDDIAHTSSSSSSYHGVAPPTHISKTSSSLYGAAAQKTPPSYGDYISLPSWLSRFCVICHHGSTCRRAAHARQQRKIRVMLRIN